MVASPGLGEDSESQVWISSALSTLQKLRAASIFKLYSRLLEVIETNTVGGFFLKFSG